MAYSENKKDSADKTDKSDSADKAPCCEGCIKWEEFGRKCWVYWDKKKVCSQHTDNEG